MIQFKNRVPQTLKLLSASVILVVLAVFWVSAPVQAAKSEEGKVIPAIVCSDQMALDAAKSDSDVKKCVAKARSMYPGRAISVSVSSVPQCTASIRGCTYTINISLIFPCPNPPFCLLGVDILVATVHVNCGFNVTNVICHL